MINETYFQRYADIVRSYAATKNIKAFRERVYQLSAEIGGEEVAAIREAYDERQFREAEARADRRHEEYYR